MNRYLLVSVLFFLVGGGAGLLIGMELASHEDAGLAPRAQPEMPPRPEVSSTPPAKDQAPERIEPPRPRPRTAKVKPDQPAPNTPAGPAPTPTPDRPGAGVITGRVVTETGGTPVAGVTVVATIRARSSDPGRRSDLPPAEEDLDSAVRHAVEQYHLRKKARRQAITGEDGRYTLKDIGDAAYQVRPYKKNHEVVPTRLRTWRQAKAGDTVDFRARPVVWIRVSVVQTDGTPTAEATVFFKSEASTRSHNWTPGSPDIRIEPGAYTVRAEAETGQASPGREVVVKAGEDPALLILELQSRPAVTGRVSFEGKEPRQAFVWFQKHAGGALPDGADLARGGGPREFLHASLGFRFHFTNLSPGTYVLGAGRTREFAERVELVVVANGPVEKNLHVPLRDPANYICVRVLGPDGQPLPKVRFGIRMEDGQGGIRSSGAESFRQEDGSFWIRRLVEKKGEPEAKRHVLVATSRNHGSKEAEFRPGVDSTITIRFEGTASLEVTVTGYTGRRSAAKLRVGLQKPSESSRYIPSDQSPDEQGLVTLGPFQPGSYELVLTVEIDRHSSIPLSRTPVVLQDGVNRMTVPLPALYPLTVQVDDGKGIRLMLRSVEHGVASVHISKTVDENGRATFDFLPAGVYTLTAMPLGQMQISVPAAGVVRFAPRPVNALRVTITQPDGAMARAGFQTGDLVVGIDRTRFQNLGQIHGLMTQARGKTTADFMVVRSGQELVIRFDSRQLDSGQAGGRFDMASQ